MRVEVDQSGKIEQTWMDTVVAFSNNYQFAVLLPKQLKRQLLKKYRSEKQAVLKLFVVSVYYALKDYLNTAELIIIDNEYDGKQDYIKSLLLSFIRRSYPNFDKRLISFGTITKRSKAHEVALNVHKGRAKPQRILTEKDVDRMIESGGSARSSPASTALSLSAGADWHGTLHHRLALLCYYIKIAFLGALTKLFKSLPRSICGNWFKGVFSPSA